jgi:hypothetical protein
MSPIFAKDVRIQGNVVGVGRRYWFFFKSANIN